MKRFSVYVTNNGLVSKIYKELPKIKKKMTNDLVENQAT